MAQRLVFVSLTTGFRWKWKAEDSDVSDITAALLSGEQSHSVDEAITDSPLLHSSLTSTLFETLVHLFDWFSSHPSLSKEAF